MARAKNRKEENPTFGRTEPNIHFMWALACLVTGVLSAVALLDYDWHQNPRFQNPVIGQNQIGSVGLFIASQSLSLLGRASFILPSWLLWMSGMLFLRQSRKLILGRYIAWVGIFFSVPVLFDLWMTYTLATHPGMQIDRNYYQFGYGGWMGKTLYTGLAKNVLGQLGTIVVFAAITGAAAVYVFFDNIGIALHRLGKWSMIKAGEAYNGLNSYFAGRSVRQREMALRQQQLAEERAEAYEAAMAERAEQEAAQREAGEAELPEEMQLPPPVAPQTSSVEMNSASGQGLISPEEAMRQLRNQPEPPIEEPSSEPVEAAQEPEAVEKPEDEEAAAANEEAPAEAEEEPAPKKPRAAKAAAMEAATGLKIVQEALPKKAAYAQPQKKGNYEFPTLDLLVEPPPPPPSDDAETHQQIADQLVKTLSEFGVKVTMGEVHPGPVITRYDLYPAAGVRVEKIQNLEKNLALALCAMSVRILAPVPGKGCVGVEIPNKQPQSVFVRDILESEDWVKSKAEIPIALGKEVSGKPLVADLTKMPHMLIAGATGSGKTVCINAIVASLLYKMSPDDVRFVMVDPKIVEMQVYNALPHMLIPVVTDPRKVPGALKYLINEMERRYRLFAKEGVRNIAGYNAKRSKDKEAEEKAKEMDAALSPEERQAAQAATIEVPRELDLEDAAPEKLPYIVCIVDELADLMMVAPADVETGIARLAQLARAAGIHLIIATQRPSVNVITGIIKANLPSRIAFKVASKVDSRTILDYGGADQLIGRGDMLFMPPGIAELVRSQGAFVADEEINRIVEFVNKHNGEPLFDEQFQRSVEESAEEGQNGGEDEKDDGDALIPDALEVIRTTSRASTSMLQRRLRIGYNRAARIMEILEDRGYVGPENGSMPREILRDLNQD
jgi:DNA segregation ATPase FtsK/SpoIIIE, S-DNA-T family